ncbi:MAG: hypothetical protein KAR06_06615, partial [Deltaproteobacteria bacterium]|nr:hypothetical protein [Deltaproteobacteria bacterium]
GGVNLGVGLAPLLKRELLYNESLLQILLVPVRIFTSGRDDSIEFFDGVLNPLYLVFILLAFITRRNFELKIMAAYAVVYFVVAFFMVDLVSRYLMPVIPIMIIIVVYGVRNSFEQRRFFVVPIIIFLLIGAMNIKYALDLYTKRGAPGYFLSDETREGYLVRTAPDYGAIAFANKNLSSEAKVKAFFTGARGYYWEREFVNSSVFGSEILAIVRSSNGRMSISGAFKKDGTTHIFVRDTLFIKFIKDNLSEAELDKMKNFFVTGMRLLYSSNGYTLYELN